MKRVVALLIVLALMLPCATAFAARNETVYAARKQVQVYAAKSTSARKLGKLSYGESVIGVNYKENAGGWVKIKNDNGAVGFCKTNQLTGSDPNDLSYKVEAKNRAKLYAKPLTTSRMLAKFADGVKVKIVALTPDGDWFRVKYSGYYGYMQVADIKWGDKVWYTGDMTSMHYANGVGINILSYGESLKTLGYYNGKAVVRANKEVGYIIGGIDDDFTDEDPNVLSNDMYAAAAGARVYSEAQNSATYSAHKLERGAKITVVGEGTDYYRVKYGGKYGYVLKKCFVDERPEEDVIVIAKKNLKLYKGKISTGDVIGSANKGEALTLLEIKHARVKVTNLDGVTGWISIYDFEIN